MPDASSDIFAPLREGDTAAVRAVLAANPDAVRHTKSDGSTPAHYAAYFAHPEILEELLEHGADPNARNQAGHSPLHFAAFGGCSQSFSALVNHGADIAAVDEFGTGILHAAATGGSIHAIECLVDLGCGMDTPNAYSERPLHRAAQAGKLDVVQWLLEHGAEPNPVDDYRLTILHKAVVGGAADVVSYLLERGDDAEARDQVGDTPLHSAASFGRIEIVSLLLSHGVPVDILNHEDQTPLYTAAIAGHHEIVRLLLEHHAETRIANHLGRTALHAAAAHGHQAVIRTLAEAAAPLDSPDADGNTPLDLAGVYARSGAWEALRSLGAQPGRDIRPEDAGAQIERAVAPGEAICWYLGHSGWAVRTANHLLIFDYAPSGRAGGEDSLANGRIHPEQLASYPVTVFVSHHHTDHFDRHILEWQQQIPDIRYVFGWDAEVDTAGLRFGGTDVEEIDGLRIGAIPATDSGSAFAVEVDGIVIYHAGDHVAGRIPPEPAFTDGITYLAERFAPVDLAFLPAFGCGFPSTEALRSGSLFTLEHLDVAATLPMHIGWTSALYRQFARRLRDEGCTRAIHPADEPGDRFLFSNGTLRRAWI